MILRALRLIFPMLLTAAALTAALLPVASCHRHGDVSERLDLADSLIEIRPDSSLAILDGIAPEDIRGKEQAARHALLKSMALDKNYVDTTTFDILQPAIDYYLEHGSPDEKLRTCYYQGRIYYNQGDDDSAMMCFMKASDLKEHITDSLVLARNFIMMSVMYHKQWKTEDYIEYCIDAARIYGKYGKKDLEINSYARALAGSILLCDKSGADSLLSVCTGLLSQYPEGEPEFFPSYLSYIIEYGTPEETKSFLTEYRDRELSLEDTIDFARGYAKVGEFGQALSILSNVQLSGSIMDSLKYAAVKASILEQQGNYEEAFRAYKVYTDLSDRHYSSLMNHKMLFSDEFHRLEIKDLESRQYRKRILWISVSGFLSALLLACLLYFRYRLVQSKRIIAEKNLERIDAERRQRELESDNLRLEKSRLEDERDRLMDLIKKHKELSGPVKDVMRIRHDMLNSILAKDIANNDNYARPYNKWIESIRNDKDEFMNSTRLAFTASHPAFIEYLGQKGLTTDEINYLCLYAIGLRGKDVGEYIQLKRHYTISSELRMKLGLDEHDTNLGKYVRKLLNEL